MEEKGGGEEGAMGAPMGGRGVLWVGGALGDVMGVLKDWRGGYGGLWGHPWVGAEAMGAPMGGRRGGLWVGEGAGRGRHPWV